MIFKGIVEITVGRTCARMGKDRKCEAEREEMNKTITQNKPELQSSDLNATQIYYILY